MSCSMSSVSDIKLIRTDFFFFFFEILFCQCAKGHTLQHYLQCYKKVLTVTSGLQEVVTSGKTVFTIFNIFLLFFFCLLFKAREARYLQGSLFSSLFFLFFLMLLLFKTWGLLGYRQGHKRKGDTTSL